MSRECARTQASELAWRRSNVGVAVLCPSYVRTNVVASTAAASLGSKDEGDGGGGPCMTEAELAMIQASVCGATML